jgi:hypothetical protein
VANPAIDIPHVTQSRLELIKKIATVIATGSCGQCPVKNPQQPAFTINVNSQDHDDDMGSRPKRSRPQHW